MKTVSYKENAMLTRNEFNQGDSDTTFDNVAYRLIHPDDSDIDAIDIINDILQEEKLMKGDKLKKNLTQDDYDKIEFYSDGLALFNLSHFWNGFNSEESFIESKYLTYCLKCDSSLAIVKNKLKENPQTHCAFVDHFGINLIVVFRLCEAVRNCSIYKLLFQTIAEQLQKELDVTVLNLDSPLAFFYFSNDPEAYVNKTAEVIHVIETLESLNN